MKSKHGSAADQLFIVALIILGGSYVVLIVLLIAADLAVADTAAIAQLLRTPEIRYAVKLSLLSSTASAVLSLWIAVPIAYICSRFRFPGKAVIDTILDVPVVLPPLVVGVSLLVLFNLRPFAWISHLVVFEIPAIIMAQTVVACAFAVRTLRVCFDQIPLRYEAVAMTLGCSRREAFWRVCLPQAREDILAAGTLAWARAFGEFGPILVFAGAARFRTEVLPTSVYLEMQSGDLRNMLAISLLMIVAAGSVLLTARLLGLRGGQL